MIKFLTRQTYRPLGSGDSAIAELLERHVDPSPEDSALFDLEYQREVYRWAAQKVQKQVKANTWQAFSMTIIDGRSTADVSQQLGMTIGAIHIACSRVRGRLRDLVAEHERDGSQ
jgi:RNA polymerase sigma-70 factor (ECF subfamily)